MSGSSHAPPRKRWLRLVAGLLATLLLTLGIAAAPASGRPTPDDGGGGAPADPPPQCSEENVPGCVEDESAPATEARDRPCKGLSVGCMVERAVYKIFGGQRGWITAPFLRWLIRVPNLAGSEGAIADAAQFTRSAGWALLLALVTFSVFHYWAVGLTSHGGSTVIFDAVTRSVGAALFILAWPWIFENGVALTDTLSNELVPGAQMEAFAAELLAGTTIALFFSGPVALSVGIIIALAFTLLSLAVYLTKLGLTVGLLIAYVSFPLAAALWAIPATAQPASYAARFCAAAASTQVIWAVTIKLVGALNKDTIIFWSAGGVWTDKITKPLFLAAMLIAMLSVPLHTFQAWGLGLGGGGGFLGSTASFMASSYASNKLPALGTKGTQIIQWGARRLPGRWPQRGSQGASPQRGGQQPQDRKRQNTGHRHHSPSHNGGRPRGHPRSAPPPRGHPHHGQPRQRGHGQLPAGGTASDARAAYDAIRSARTTDRGRFREALSNVSAAGFGPPTLEVLGGSGTYAEDGPRDKAIMREFGRCSVAEGVSPSLGADFGTLASSTPGTRVEGLSGWTPPPSQTRAAPQPPPPDPVAREA